MKPILVHGHERSLTQIKYNREGDLLFSTSKDKSPSVWWSHSGERIGSYEGHNGTVWCCSVDYTSKYFITGSADNSIKLWNTETGEELWSLETKSAVRSCNFSYDGRRICFTTDNTMKQQSGIFIYELERILDEGTQAEPTSVFYAGNKITASVWGVLDKSIITGQENGEILQWSLETGNVVLSDHTHTGVITDMQYNVDQSLLLTSSKDTTANLYDTERLTVLKKYNSQRPINSAAISPIKNHVIVGGGQDARSVTTTHGKQGMFETKFFHLIYQDTIGTVKAGFGPTNSVAFHPSGKGFATAGEDGIIRIHTFDPVYFKMDDSSN